MYSLAMSGIRQVSSDLVASSFEFVEVAIDVHNRTVTLPGTSVH